MVIEEKDFSFDYGAAFSGGEFLDAYAKLLLDAIEGNQTSFVSTEEISASWKFIDPIISAWRENHVPIVVYPKGSKPQEVSDLTTVRLMPKKEISYIGLGKMGLNMVERLLDYGWDVTAYDADNVVRERAKKLGVKVVESVSDVISASEPESTWIPGQARDDIVRVIWLMVPHGVVDAVLEELTPHLQPGDTVIDGGNSFYKDSNTKRKQPHNTRTFLIQTKLK